MKRESIQTWLIIGLVVIIILLVFRYFNLSVSEKYETQLEGLNATKEQLKNAIDLKNKIDFQKKVTVFLIIICFVLFYPIVLLKKKF